MDEILPGLWVGGVRAAMDTDYLSRAGITHIISCMKQLLPAPPTLPDGRMITKAEMRHVKLDDDEKAPILVHFAGCNELISQQLEEEWVPDDESSEQSEPEGDEVELLVQGRQKRNGRWGSWQTTGAGTVLVHCQAGCSRSVAIVAAYLMHTRHISPTTAVSMIRARRPDAGPNAGFMAQLQLYEEVGYEVDMKYQSVRRFLMSKTDILNGDSTEDLVMSYYPSPYPSPGLTNGGVKGLSALSTDDSSSNRTSTESESRPPKVKLARSRSASSTSSAARLCLLSSIHPDPADASDASSLAKQISSMSTAPQEVVATKSTSSRLPGGVSTIKGHESASNRGRLARPSWEGPKLRCKGCRRELAALDHVVLHEPGRGQMAFDHRKRDTGFSKDGNVASGPQSSTDKGAEEEETTASTPNAASDSSSSSSTTPDATAAPTPTPAPTRRIQSGASLNSQLPPHLAALRRSRPPTTPSMSSMLKSPQCSSYFLEPMAWMSDLASGEVTGRLNCPAEKCGQKLGSWDWAGMQCGCGAWVTPAFSLHRSKVDEI